MVATVEGSFAGGVVGVGSRSRSIGVGRIGRAFVGSLLVDRLGRIRHRIASDLAVDNKTLPAVAADNSSSDTLDSDIASDRATATCYHTS